MVIHRLRGRTTAERRRENKKDRKKNGIAGDKKRTHTTRGEMKNF